MNVYSISGVGADRRIFKNICLPENCNLIHLDWIKPHSGESLESYALRLAANINKHEPFVLMGLSFGGMLANEIARRYPAECVFLISSVPSSSHLPPYFKWAGRLKLHKLIPVSLLKSASLLKRLFTAETREEKKFLREAIRKADTSFIRWTLDAILNWKWDKEPDCYVHVHGSQDLILPIRYSGATHVIKGEGHMMVLTRGKEISRIFAEKLKELETVRTLRR